MDGNTEDLQKFVPQVHFEQIPIKNLCSNQDYQRNLSIKHVQRDRKSTRLNSSHVKRSRMPSSA